jgi:hypothetical protein
MLAGFLSGILSAFIAYPGSTGVEAGFGYCTNIRLLEMGNLNNPLLKSLIVHAPGTYHHCIIVGSLAEAAAESVGVNPLLARVGSYYHDIGKMKKPLYFIENQQGVENKHDKLQPRMSALILISHVKEGVEIARAHKLGRDLIDIIREHHGTSVISYFFNRAKEKENPEVSEVKESDYRYQGPKPQSKVAALVMLADAVEAATRSLTDPTPARIQGMVQKIINKNFVDDQLSDCELTLKDMHTIAKSFNRILQGIYHHRIDYPQQLLPKDISASKKKSNGDTAQKPAEKGKGKSDKTKKDDKDEIKRLGI